MSAQSSARLIRGLKTISRSKNLIAPCLLFISLFFCSFSQQETFEENDLDQELNDPLERGWNPYKRSLSGYRFRFLTNDLSSVDGRPVFAPDGNSVVFMRQKNDGDPGSLSALYSVPISGKEGAKLLFAGANPLTGEPFNATRPDYSWDRKSYQIAFDALGSGIWLLDVKTKNVRQVLSSVIDGTTYTWSYPAWYKGGDALSVTNYNSFGEPLYHQLVKADANTLNAFTPVTDNQTVWVGESSVQQKKKPLLVFAGEPPVAQPPSSCICPGGCTADGYAQNCNQIWLQESGAAAPIDALQGRAPWFSPNGKYVVFESNRANPDHPDLYRLFVYTLKDRTLRVVTPPSLNVQHAKWSPDGKKLAFAVQLFGGAQGIAVVELE